MPLNRFAAGAAALAMIPSVASAASADPAAIDAAVAGFTGAAVGEPGGARLPVDRRLRLAPCGEPLALEWHGGGRATVLVRCPVAGGWRLYVPVEAGPGAAAAAAASIVSRGESVAIAVRGRGFTLTRQGEALEGGAAGEWIRVRPAGTRTDPMRARVLRPGLVGADLP